MTTTNKPRLAFGLNAAIPEGYTSAAWGARLIYPDDLVWDRQSTIHLDPDAPEAEREADEKRLHDWLNGTGLYPERKGSHPLARALDAVKGHLRPDENREITLYEDEIGIIKGNPNASYGYVYIAATLK